MDQTVIMNVVQKYCQQLLFTLVLVLSQTFFSFWYCIEVLLGLILGVGVVSIIEAWFGLVIVLMLFLLAITDFCQPWYLVIIVSWTFYFYISRILWLFQSSFLRISRLGYYDVTARLILLIDLFSYFHCYLLFVVLILVICSSSLTFCD